MSAPGASQPPPAQRQRTDTHQDVMLGEEGAAEAADNLLQEQQGRGEQQQEPGQRQQTEEEEEEEEEEEGKEEEPTRAGSVSAGQYTFRFALRAGVPQLWWLNYKDECFRIEVEAVHETLGAVGDARGWFIKRKRGRGTNFHELCDATCDELLEVGLQMFSRDGTLRTDCVPHLGHVEVEAGGRGGVVHLELVKLIEEHRGGGRDVGIAMVHALLGWLPSDAAFSWSLAVLMPGLYNERSDPTPAEDPLPKVQTQWARLGFRQVSGSSYWCLPASQLPATMQDVPSKASVQVVVSAVRKPGAHGDRTPSDQALIDRLAEVVEGEELVKEFRRLRSAEFSLARRSMDPSDPPLDPEALGKSYSDLLDRQVADISSDNRLGLPSLLSGGACLNRAFALHVLMCKGRTPNEFISEFGQRFPNPVFDLVQKTSLVQLTIELINAGADVNGVDLNGDTPLHSAPPSLLSTSSASARCSPMAPTSPSATVTGTHRWSAR